MKKKILVIILAMALILTAGCNSKSDSKDNKEPVASTEAEGSENVSVETDAKEKETSDKASDAPSDATTEETAEATTEVTAESTEEHTAPTETSERNESECVFDLTGKTAEEIADICDSLTNRKIPKVGDLYSEVLKNYYDVEPWRYTLAFCGRYGSSKKDNVNCIYVSGVFIEGTEEQGGPFVKSIDQFGTGIVIDIYDYAKAQEFIKIMKERHPVIEEKTDGSWRSDDFIVGITPIDFFSLENGVHFQIAYGEHSDWYESVAAFFGFGMEITSENPEQDTSA